MSNKKSRRARHAGESHQPRKLTPQDRTRMFKAWQAHPTVLYVAQTTGFVLGTVSKYRKLDRWDERWAEIQAKADVLSDENAAVSLARVLENVTDLQDMMIGRLRELLEAKQYTPQIRDVDLLVRLEQYLRGQHESEPHDEEDIWVVLQRRIAEYDRQRAERRGESAELPPGLFPPSSPN